MVNISIIDYIGKIEDGVAILLSMNIEEDTYEMIYWFNKTGKINITIDDDFLSKYKLKSIYEAKYLDDLLAYIEKKVLPEKEEIFKKFL